MPFDDFLKKHKVLAVAGIDTRTLAVTIRDRGEMAGIVATGDSKREELLRELKDRLRGLPRDHVAAASVKKVSERNAKGRGPKIGVLDLGTTASFLAQMETLGCRLALLPFGTPAASIAKMGLKGLVVSNGPENDKGMETAAATVRDLLGKLPMLGVGAGHEVIALALGAKLKKMKTGHHGVNYPIIGPKARKGDITAQNHSYVVDGNSLRGDVRVTFVNLNDRTVEQMESAKQRFVSIQYVPTEPEPGEPHPVLRRFVETAAGRRGRRA
jgi:carbamoyl-phosphate synthase small subunit